MLTEEEVDKIVDDFVLAAKIAHAVGADGIDMKLCHGYLGSQILRPYNDRKGIAVLVSISTFHCLDEKTVRAYPRTYFNRR